MKVLITGGAGFLGARLARALLDKGSLKDDAGRDCAIDRIVVLDVTEPRVVDDRVQRVTGDLSDPSLLKRAVDADTGAVFLLAAIVCGMAESDFDLGMRINVDATRALLEACRATGRRPRLVFTSSVAVYGGDFPPVLLDSIALTPQTSYGTQKAIGELLVTDYTRRGFVDGRSVRLPTITVRPGRPNAAASSFASGVIREPLNGEPAICPVGPDARIWVASPQTAVDGLIRAHDLSSDRFGVQRWVGVPGLSVTAGEMVASLERIAGPEAAARVRWQPDPRIQRMVNGWPGALDNSRALALGFPVDESFDAIVRQYVKDVAPGL
jgi:nucleoside-diphosphate-sugar epimerase